MDLGKLDLFYRLPQPFQRRGPKEILAYGLGATLYMPATRKNILADLLSDKLRGLKSVVICLEDAVGDQEIKEAENNLILQFKEIIRAKEEGQLDYDEIPLIFVRVRGVDQIYMIADVLKGDQLLNGFVFPKFNLDNGSRYLKALKEVNREYQQNLYGMPVLEDRNVLYKENRIENLQQLKRLLDEHKDLILNIRIGATDFSSIFALRRSVDTLIYDIAVVRDCIGDIINIFGREETDYVLSGAVWEYYSNEEGYDLTKKALSGLVKEVLLDKENGLVGKTTIHPSQILPIQSLYVVTHEEYLDATKILDLKDHGNGVIKSQYGNKMNEVKPHYNWAKKILIRSKIYGVLKEGINFEQLLK